MSINVGGPQSEIEVEAKKRFITEKEIKIVLTLNSPKELRKVKSKLMDLLDFYNRIINSIDYSIKSINSNKVLTHKQKKDMYLNTQEKELSQAKLEKSKLRRYLNKINSQLNEM